MGDLNRSIKDAEADLGKMSDAVSSIEGVVVDDIVSTLSDGVAEILNYLLEDAKEAQVHIAELEEEVERIKRGNCDSNEDS